MNMFTTDNPSSRDSATTLRQWRAVRTTGEKLNLIFQNVADDDGNVEDVTYLGGRDFQVFYSKPVSR